MMINEKLKQIMEKIEYGYIDKDNNKYYHLNEVEEKYILQTPNQIITNKIGLCFDQVELEREILDQNNIKSQSYFIINYGKKIKTHTFITYKIKDTYYWFENAWTNEKGIHQYKTKKELLKDITDKFIKDQVKNKDINIKIYNYKKPKYNITAKDFIIHCQKSKEEKI